MPWNPTASQALDALLALPFPLAALSPGLRYVGVTEAWASLYSPGINAEAWKGDDHLERFPQILTEPGWLGPLEGARSGRTSGPHVLVVKLPQRLAVLEWWAVAWPAAEGGAMILAQDVTEVAARVSLALEGQRRAVAGDN